jgi:hypothetical protein
MASLLYGKFQLFHRNFSLMEKLQNETAMYTRLVYIDTVGHDTAGRVHQLQAFFLFLRGRHYTFVYLAA